MTEMERFAIIMETIGADVRGTRRRHGLSQTDLAEKSGVAQADISRLECGRSNPSVRTLERIAAGMDTRVVFGFAELQSAPADV